MALVLSTLIASAGSLPASASISLVAANLPSAAGQSNGNPCVGGPQAAAGADTTHTGRLDASSSKVVTVPQDDIQRRLDKGSVFAVCYSETASAGIRDSQRRLWP